jgi:tRNA threonylcarbamoyladenosine biosynthesis protein TsaB
MITLALDASTYVGSVALLDGRRVLAERSVAMKGAEHERLMPAIVDVLQAGGIQVDDLARVVCGEGPGSFTSLRIAGAIAKGIASGVGIPLYAVPSMALIVAGAILSVGRYLVVVDALRGDAYVGLYDVQSDGVVDELERARLIPMSDIASVAAEYDARTLGPTKDLVSTVATPIASGIAVLEAWLSQRAPVDLASWEPSYGRLAEAQVRWETAHGRPLPAG